LFDRGELPVRVVGRVGKKFLVLTDHDKLVVWVRPKARGPYKKRTKGQQPQQPGQ
jgi:hypothetical protein